MAVVAIVKYTGGANDLAWRFPSEGLGTWTQLIVNESQEAILFKGGQALDVFVFGQHELSVNNIPLLNKLVNLPAGKRSPLVVDIWYVNKGHTLEVKWGTPVPVEVPDPKYKTLIPLRAFGQFSIQVREPTTFLNNFVGSLPSLDNDSLIKHFKGLFLGRLKENIISYIEEKEISVLEIGTYLDDLSEHLKTDIMPILDDRSVKLIDFRLNNIKLSEDSLVVKQMNAALAKKAVAELVGDEYVQEKSPKPPVSVPNSDLNAFDGMSEQANEQEQNYKVPIIRTCPVCYHDLEEGVRYCRECKYDTMGDGLATQSPEAIPEAKNPVSEIAKPTPTEQCPVIPKLSFESEEFDVKKCSRCGTQLSAKQKFCHKCGSKS